MKKNTLLFVFLAIALSSCIKDRVSGPPGTSPLVTGTGDSLIHYWNCNTDSANIRNPTFTRGGGGFMYGGAYLDTVWPGTSLNGWGIDSTTNGEGALRLRNPASGPFTLTMPTTGFKNIILKFAAERTSKGSQTNILTYTIDGTNYINTAIASSASVSIDTVFHLMSFDFSSDTLVNNNPHFKVQINFAGGNTNTSGNDRYDNIALLGQKL